MMPFVMDGPNDPSGPTTFLDTRPRISGPGKISTFGAESFVHQRLYRISSVLSYHCKQRAVYLFHMHPWSCRHACNGLSTCLANHAACRPCDMHVFWHACAGVRKLSDSGLSIRSSVLWSLLFHVQFVLECLCSWGNTRRIVIMSQTKQIAPMAAQSMVEQSQAECFLYDKSR